VNVSSGTGSPHPGCPRQSPECRKMVVCVCVCVCVCGQQWAKYSGLFYKTVNDVNNNAVAQSHSYQPTSGWNYGGCMGGSRRLGHRQEMGGGAEVVIC